MFHRLDNIQPKEVLPGLVGKFVHSEKMTFAYWNIKKGSALPAHSHIHEQVINVLEGEFEVTINGTSEILTKGMMATFPSNVIHAGQAITECKILDVFSPIREDYR